MRRAPLPLRQAHRTFLDGSTGSAEDGPPSLNMRSYRVLMLGNSCQIEAWRAWILVRLRERVEMEAVMVTTTDERGQMEKKADG